MTFLNSIKFKQNRRILNCKKRYGRTQGLITIRYHKKGHKRLYRDLQYSDKLVNTKSLVTTIEYDPNRSNFICEVMYKKGDNKIFNYMSTTDNINVFKQLNYQEYNKSYIQSDKIIVPIKTLGIGDIICNIEKYPGSGSKFVRSAGTYAQIISFEAKRKPMVKVQFPSKEQYYIYNDCNVMVGKNSNIFHSELKKWKAGNSKHHGVKSKVRGVAKNPVDHPHGGGEGKTSAGRPPVTPQGFLTKGVPTRKKKTNDFFIALKRRKHPKWQQ